MYPAHPPSPAPPVAIRAATDPVAGVGDAFPVLPDHPRERRQPPPGKRGPDDATRDETEPEAGGDEAGETERGPARPLDPLRPYPGIDDFA